MWPEIRKRVPHATFHVIGDVAGWVKHYEGNVNRQGLCAARVQAAIANLGHDGADVRFLGRLSRKDVLREISEAQVFAFPFEAPAGPCETWSVATMEALAIGCYVVLNEGDALESIYHGRAAFPSPEFGLDFVDQVAHYLVTDPDKNADFRDGTKAWARSFTFENSAKALDRAIRENLPGAKKVRTEPGFRSPLDVVTSSRNGSARAGQ
jgi:glycosyltransferase involved in cell wall biosynthesis